jgi:hypothetical protein
MSRDMRRSTLLVAAVLVVALAVSLAAAAALRDGETRDAGRRTTLTESEPASQPDQESTRKYLRDCDVDELSAAGEQAYRMLDRLAADGLAADETGAAFDARGVLMGEASCWPDGYPDLDLGNDYACPPPETGASVPGPCRARAGS